MGTGTTTFAYDAAGIRVKTVKPNGVVIDHPFPNYEVENPATEAITIRRSIYTIAGQTVATRVNDNLYFFFTDHLGSTAVMATSANAPVSGSRATYLPFGNYRGAAPTQTITDRDFTGQPQNRAVGLLYYQARFYVPGIGRFASADTLVPDHANPQSYNRYTYVYNNPLVYIDKDGHLPVIPVLIGAGIVALKVIDYGWTAWDVYQAGRTLANPGASQMDRMTAGLTVGLAVLFEAIEPDDILPVGLPIDDVARRAVVKGAQEAFESGGREGAERFLRNQLGDHADVVLRKMDELLGVQAPNWRSGLRQNMGAQPNMVNAQAHHNLPWTFREWFAQPGRGLNVNDPAFGRWVQGTPPGQHQNWTNRYEQAWRNWIRDNPNATRQQVLDFLQTLLDSGLYP